MSGFSQSWLLMREPADHAARNSEITAQLVSFFSGRDRLSILDLGCGTGSTVRALAPELAATEQHWRLLDYDRDLLQAAEERLAAWADAVESRSPLVLSKNGRRLAITAEWADLSRELPADWKADLVTASALLDLVSAGWMIDLAGTVAAHRAVFLGALNYDGSAEWSPPHPLDGAMRIALNAHQRTDKGFGPSLGPEAPDLAAEAFARAGYRVCRGESPWRLGGAGDRALRSVVANGFVTAARALGAADEEVLAEWLACRRDAAGAACIGHVDLLALPPASDDGF